MIRFVRRDGWEKTREDPHGRVAHEIDPMKPIALEDHVPIDAFGFITDFERKEIRYPDAPSEDVYVEVGLDPMKAAHACPRLRRALADVKELQLLLARYVIAAAETEQVTNIGAMLAGDAHTMKDLATQDSLRAEALRVIPPEILRIAQKLHH